MSVASIPRNIPRRLDAIKAVLMRIITFIVPFHTRFPKLLPRRCRLPVVVAEVSTLAAMETGLFNYVYVSVTTSSL
jgi:hypothetical protein